MEFASALLSTIGAFYNASDEAALQARAADIRARLGQIEAELGDGPYFDGDRFSMVDAALGPVFRYFDTFDRIGDFGFWEGLPKVWGWRISLAARPSVLAAVSSGYANRLQGFLLARGSALSQRMLGGVATGVHAA